jgi:hypothetical protein
MCSAGLLVLVASWLLRDDSWWPGALTEAGVAVLLFAPLLLISRGIEHTMDTLREAQRQAKQHQQELEERQQGLADQQLRTESKVVQLAHEVADAQTAMRLTSEQLSDAVLKRIVETRDKDAALFASVAESPTWEAVLGSLMRARDLDMTPAWGCRVSLFGMDCYLRFQPEWTYPGNPNPDQEPNAIQLTLEFTDGTARRTILWEPVETPTGIVMQVAEAMQSLSCYPGDNEFKAGSIFRGLGDLLQLAHRLATSGTVYPVRHIIQLCPPQWVIAEDGIYSVQPGGRYQVLASRFGEQDWRRHMYEKPWLDRDSFDDAFETARLLQRNHKLAPYDPSSDELPF